MKELITAIGCVLLGTYIAIITLTSGKIDVSAEVISYRYVHNIDRVATVKHKYFHVESLSFKEENRYYYKESIDWYQIHDNPISFEKLHIMSDTRDLLNNYLDNERLKQRYKNVIQNTYIP